MKKRGFTLIELLAVIVILAIIALIATPIVINIINDSKKESINRSIELYLDHVQKIIAKEQMKDPTFNPSECEIKSEGKLLCGTKEIQIEMKGKTPKSGTIKFSKGMVIEGVNLELDNLYYQVTDDNISKGMKEKVISYSDYITKVSDADNDGKISPGDEYTYEVMDNMEKPYTFYVLSVEGDKVNLIMDRNICTNGDPADKDHQCNYAWHAGSNNNNYGPDTAMTNLYNATKNWTNVPNIDLSGENAYEDENNKTDSTKGYKGITIKNGVATITGKNGANNTTIGTTEQPLKARLPKKSEVNEAGCTGSSGSSPIWLVENLRYETNLWSLSCAICPTKYASNNGNGIEDIYGYWLLSSYSGNSNAAHNVEINGWVTYENTSNARFYGLRPVITVSKSDLQ